MVSTPHLVSFIQGEEKYKRAKSTWVGKPPTGKLPFYIRDCSVQRLARVPSKHEVGFRIPSVAYATQRSLIG